MTGNHRSLQGTSPRRLAHGGALSRLAAALLLLVALGAEPARAAPIDDAKAAASARRWALAADAWATVLDKSPRSKEAALGLADAAIRAGRADHFQAAEDALRGLVEANAKDAELLVGLGSICLATSAAKSDTLAKKSYDVEAKDNFAAALKLAPDSDLAAAGLAQTYYQVGDFAKAIETVDEFLAMKPKAPTRALFWKGQTLYLQARDAFAAGGNKLTPEAAQLFRKAQGAYQASAHVGGKEPDVWIQLAYASTYLGGAGNIQTAGDAYRSAAAIDATSKAPFTGLKSLYTHTPKVYVQALKALIAKQPKHEWALWFYAVNRYEAQDWRSSQSLFERYAAVAVAPAQGWYFAGVCADQIGETVAAEAAYYEALKADPTHAQAAGAIQKKIMEAGAEQRARKSVKAAQQVIKEFAPLRKAAPKMAWLRNNLAFILREAYVSSREDRAWIPILKASTQAYTEASDILGEWTAEKEQTYNWAQRYSEAQIISDTGLMYQFYKPTRDYETAERYYRLALEYTDDGYKDAFNNLARILNETKRWQDLHDLCAACENGITSESGAPDSQSRAQATAIKKKLLADGRAKAE